MGEDFSKQPLSLPDRCKRVWGREATKEEILLLQRIRDGLKLREDDALWDILIALQLQKFYYDELPGKIGNTISDSLKKLEKAAEIEVQKAQGTLAESVVEQAQKLAGTSSLTTLLFSVAAVLFCAILACSISMWAGYAIGLGKPVSPDLLLRVPAGLVLAAVSLGSGIFLLLQGAHEFAASRAKTFRKKAAVGLGAVLVGALILSRTF